MSFKSMGGRPATKSSAWLITACLSALSSSGYATAEHRYGPGEYDLIDHGLAPDQQYAILAHGDREGNPEHLRLFLVDARTYRRIGPLEEVKDAGLDTAPEAFHARWSPDSRHVALSYRTDRHVNALRIYRIEHCRAFPVSGPGLLATVAPDFRVEDLDVTAHYRELEWLCPTRFRLHEDGYVRQLRRFQNPAELLKAIPTITGAIDARRRITRQSLQKRPSTASRVGTRKPPARLAPVKFP